jgi:hypothetical protein
MTTTQSPHSGNAEYPQFAAGIAQYPPARRPHPAPTAPPWVQPAPAEVYAAPAPIVGGLLVPYPERMGLAAREQAPALWPVAIWTFFFGLFGVASAKRRADAAVRGGNSPSPYWVTWAVTLVAAGFFWSVAGVAWIRPGIDAYLQQRTVAALEDKVVHDGQLQRASLTATGAACVARTSTPADDQGRHSYICQLTLDNGKIGTLVVVADSAGNWTSAS